MGCIGRAAEVVTGCGRIIFVLRVGRCGRKPVLIKAEAETRHRRCVMARKHGLVRVKGRTRRL